MLGVINNEVRIRADLDGAPFRGNSPKIRAALVLATRTNVDRSMRPVWTPCVNSRLIRSSRAGMPLGIFVKSSRPSVFCD